MLRRALRRNIDIRGAVTRHLDARAPKPTPLQFAKRSPFSSDVASPLRSPQPLRSANRLSSRSVPATPLRSSRIDPHPVTTTPLRIRNPPPVRGSLECSQIALHRRPSPQLVCKSPFAADCRINSDVRKSPFSAGYRSESATCLPCVARSNVRKSPFTEKSRRPVVLRPQAASCKAGSPLYQGTSFFRYSHPASPVACAPASYCPPAEPAAHITTVGASTSNLS